MKVAITAKARRDLLDIQDYIARDDPWRAETFVDELYARISMIGERPLSFPLWSRAFPEYRAARYRKYLMIFRVVDDCVRLEHVVHGARDLPRILGDD